MSQEKNSKKTSFRNSVKLVGYLKETTLTEKVSSNNRHFITGNITIAVDEFNTHRVRFTAFKEDDEEKNEKYELLSKFLPANTISIASYLKSTPTANFATAASAAARVWVMAGFEEYAARKGENEKSSVLLRGYTIGNSDPKKEFIPAATFEIDTYIKDIEDEADEDDNPTGRLLITGLLPGYKGIMYQIPLVAPVEYNVAKFIRSNYKVGDTARLCGDLVAMRVRLDDNGGDDEEESDRFGKEIEPQVTTRFIREYVITSGPKKPVQQGEEGCISDKAVTEGLALRETTMDENGKRKPKETETEEGSAAVEQEESAPAPTPAPQKEEKPAAYSEDLDF